MFSKLTLENRSVIAQNYAALVARDAESFEQTDGERISALFGKTLSDKERLEVAFSCLDKCTVGLLADHLGLFSLNGEQRHLLLEKMIVDREGICFFDDFKAFLLDEDQRFQLALKYADKTTFSLFTHHFAKFEITDERKRTELLCRFATNTAWINHCLRDPKWKISDQELLWKVFLVGVSRDSSLVNTWRVKFSNPAHQGFFKALQKLNLGTKSFAKTISFITAQSFLREWGIEEKMQPHFETMGKMNEKKSLHTLFWTLRLLGVCMSHEISLAEVVDHPFFTSALAYRDRNLRDALIPKIVSFFSTPKQREYGAECLALKSFPKHAHLPVLLLSFFLDSSKEVCNALVTFSRDRTFKEAKNLAAYLDGLTLILEEKQWSQEDKNHLLKLIPLNGVDRGLPLLQILPSIHGLGGAAVLKSDNLQARQDDVEQILCEEFKKEIPIKQEELFKKHYLALKEKFRVPNALLIYAGKINKWSITEEKKQLKEVFASFIDALLEDLENPAGESYRKWRYSRELSDPLKDVFSRKETLFTQWKENKVVPLPEFIESCVRNSLWNAWYRYQPEAYSNLLAYCKGWTIVETDDPVDLFLCGTETDSCQTILKPLGDNRGLLAIPRDRKMKMLAVKTANGTLAARRIWRMLPNQTNTAALLMEMLYQQPAYKDQLYGILEIFAQQTAQKYNVPLLVSAHENKSLGEKLKQYEGNLFSAGSPAPFEYVDAITRTPDGQETPVGALMKGGVYVIDNAYYYPPNRA